MGKTKTKLCSNCHKKVCICVPDLTVAERDSITEYLKNNSVSIPPEIAAAIQEAFWDF